jgi:phthiocerol/phenolphthiocerol synthesis type-I polyketide synthase C
MTDQIKHSHQLVDTTENNHFLTPGSMTMEPIAIVGMGCRFPGKVASPKDFWQMLVNEKEAIAEIPSDRIDLERLYDPRPATPGKIMSKWGGYLDNIDSFDAYFFGISPMETERLDPQQRLLLEVGWEAFTDAGLPIQKLAGSDTGVFVGMWLNDFEGRLFSNSDLIDLYMTTGSGRYSASGRLSFFFDFHGPSVTLDTACSSSLVSVHMACQSLRQGECGVALAGGANVILQPHITIAYSQSKMMAPDGKCKFGDAMANGYVRSEGTGLVVLKRLSDAVADGDRIYALIRGSAVNNDGRSSGFMTTPAQEGQMQMLRKAYQNAGIDPQLTSYVEAHGTGTRAGDPVEIGAVGKVLSENRSSDNPLYIGSVKTNIGHTEGAAGVAGLMKVALSLYHKQIPRSLHMQQKNPNIPWEDYHLDIPQSVIPWPNTETAVAGVSAFGIAGTNAHAVLSEAPPKENKVKAETPELYLLPVSAQTKKALAEQVESYQLFLERTDNSLADIVYTAAVRHSHLDQRAAFVASEKVDFQEQLAEFVEVSAESSDEETVSKAEKIVFVFPGQGSQWIGMGRELFAKNPLFRNIIQQCDKAIQPFTDWSLIEQLMAEPDSPSYRLDQIEVIQPTLLAIEIALAAIWQSWGVKPDAVLGHSMGEVGAAYIAGALSLEDAMRIICRRSQLMGRTSGQGAMAVVGLPIDETQTVLQGYEESLSVAVSNSPRSTVISGDTEAVDELLAKLQKDEIFCRKIKVDVASHSKQMDPIKEELWQSLQTLQPHAAQVPIYSTSTAVISDGSDLDADHWVKNLRQPVQFSKMVQQLLADEFTTFIEMSPHPVLLPAIQHGFEHADVNGFTIPSLRREEPEMATMLSALGQLYSHGYDVDWTCLYPTGNVMSLPQYPWQREHFWYEQQQQTISRTTIDHPFLNDYLLSATGAHIFELDISLERFAYLADHRVGEAIVFPAAAFIETSLAAAQFIFPDETVGLERVELREALPLSKEAAPQAQIIITQDMPGTAVFQFFSRLSQTDEWTLHADGTIRLSTEPPASQPFDIPNGDSLSAKAHYQATNARNLPYGTAFQAVRQWWQNENNVIGILAQPEAEGLIPSAYLLPPTLLDAAFQLLIGTLPPGNETYLPVSVDQVWLNGRFDPEAQYQVRTVRHSQEGSLLGDVHLFAGDQLVMAAQNLLMKPLADSHENQITDWLYEIDWQKQDATNEVSLNFAQPGTWLIFTDETDLGNTLSTHLSDAGETSVFVTPGSQYQQLSSNHVQVDPENPETLLQLVQAFGTADKPLHGIIHLWSLRQNDLLEAQTNGVFSVLHLIQAVNQTDLAEAPQLWLVTQDSVPAPGSKLDGLAASTLWGLGRVIDYEFPELTCHRVDCTANLPQAASKLWAEINTEANEREIALRENGRFVSRFVPFTPANAKANGVEIAQPGEPYRVVVTKPGILEDMVQQRYRREAPQPGEVEIEVRATGLNFMNVMSALGIYPGYENGVGPLGIECAGVITAVADDVSQFKIGDEVVGIAFNSLGSHATTNAHLIAHKPENLTFAEAATIPVVFLTAYYALNYLGHMTAGERVLIHSGTGGVGLAAIQLAQLAGAEIFATAGSSEKRDYLRQMGIAHVMDSRSLAFASEVMDATNGEGVDLLLNSLAGEAIIKGLEILKPYGRFLEIGKRDIYQNSRIGLLPFQNSLSYFAIDLDRMFRERPALIGSMLTKIMSLLAAEDIKPLPLRTYPATETADAFRFMAQAKHIGKIIVTHEPVIQDSADKPPRSSYLITGGAGALGLVTASWLAQQRPCDLILLNRSQPNATTQEAILELENLGAQVTLMQADVTSEADMDRVFNQIEAKHPPLRGVFHAAGVLADSTLSQMDQAQFKRALDPKVQGAWHLHEHTKNKELDYFVLFSSVTALLGTPGQGNYAAGNAYLDALAHYRHQKGLPALSINWGPWADVGLAAAEENRGERLAQRGVGSIPAAQGIAALSLLLKEDQTQTAVIPFNVQQWTEFYPAAAQISMFAQLMEETSSSQIETEEDDIRTLLLAEEPGRARRTLFEAHLRELTAQVLHLTASRIPLNKPLRTLGLDSLMTLELRNRLEADLGLTLPATLMWNYPTIVALAPFLASKLDISLDAENETTPSTEQQQQPVKDSPDVDLLDDMEEEDLDELDQEELEALLAEELSAIEDLLD